MSPWLTPPARVRVVTTQRRPRVGEVWAYVAAAGDVVVHRAAGHRRGLAVFVGDANPGRDELVDRERLVGLVVDVERAGVLATVPRQSGVRPLTRWALNALRRLIGRSAKGL